MSNSKKWMSSVVALALMVGFSGSVLRADDAPKAATGTISGSVVDKDSKPVPNITVSLWAAAPKKPAPPKTDIGDRTLGKKDKGEKPAKKEASLPITTAITGGDGTFNMPNVPVGEYRVDVGSHKDPAGYGKASVTVKEGLNTAVTLTMTPPKEKKAN